MTSFVDDNNNYLEYSGGDIPVTKQAASIFDFKIKGDVSLNFKIPNNSHNRKTIGYYGPNDSSKAIFSKLPFNMIRNGNFFLRGYVVVQESNDSELSCFFISGNANWFNALSVEMKNLDFDSYNVVWDYEVYDTRVASTEGIVFPIVDWGFNGLKLGHDFSPSIRSTSAPVRGFNSELVSEGYPCFYFHSALTVLANQTNIKINGDLLTDPRFLNMIMTSAGPDLKWPSAITEPVRAFVGIQVNQSYLFASGEQILQLNNVLSQGESNPFDTSSYRFYCRKTATYKIELNLDFNTNQSYTVVVYKNGSVFLNAGAVTTTSVNLIFYGNAVPGDYLDVRCTPGSSNYTLLKTSTVTFEIAEEIIPTIGYITTSRNMVITPSAIIPSIKGVDFIKFLCNFFNCIASFDEATQTLSLNKLQDITSQVDWSEYYVSHSSSYNRGLGKNNYIKLATSNEEGISRYNLSNKTGYGGGNISTSFDTKEDRVIYEAPFGPAYDQKNKTKMGWNMPFIQFFTLEDDKEYSFSGVSSSSGTATLSNSAIDSVSNYAGTIYRIESADGQYEGYFVVSPGSTLTSTKMQGVDFTTNTTGKIYSQRVSRVSGPSRILFNIPNYDQQNAGGPSQYEVWDVGGATSVMSTAQTAFFSKPKYNQNIDAFKESLSIGDIIGREFNHTMSDLYYSRIKRGFNNPLIKAKMRIPESVFMSYKFNKLVYLNTKELTGLFFINKIDNYVSARSVCDVELIFV